MLHVLGEHTGMKTELYQRQKSGVYLLGFIQAQVALINACSKRLIYTIKAKRNLFVCLRVCPEWPAMPCMEWLPALGIQG